ncbi:hypothetical protein QAD02_008845 [Eretmocerus hayati]|uniref:Uncharacterized protein n=1 Tax=Eretmocerus hayati TaxID=131215 RepID=A0ACC2N893_9HYME|nr:hypothetical protein QAD02_008845 [Eretmocerus hayati]
MALITSRAMIALIVITLMALITAENTSSAEEGDVVIGQKAQNDEWLLFDFFRANPEKDGSIITRKKRFEAKPKGSKITYVKLHNKSIFDTTTKIIGGGIGKDYVEVEFVGGEPGADIHFSIDMWGKKP